MLCLTKLQRESGLTGLLHKQKFTPKTYKANHIQYVLYAVHETPVISILGVTWTTCTALRHSCAAHVAVTYHILSFSSCSSLGCKMVWAAEWTSVWECCVLFILLTAFLFRKQTINIVQSIVHCDEYFPKKVLVVQNFKNVHYNS